VQERVCRAARRSVEPCRAGRAGAHPYRRRRRNSWSYHFSDAYQWRPFCQFFFRTLLGQECKRGLTGSDPNIQHNTYLCVDNLDVTRHVSWTIRSARGKPMAIDFILSLVPFSSVLIRFKAKLVEKTVVWWACSALRLKRIVVVTPGQFRLSARIGYFRKNSVKVRKRRQELGCRVR
jgi:hypothetical protein